MLPACTPTRSLVPSGAVLASQTRSPLLKRDHATCPSSGTRMCPPRPRAGPGPKQFTKTLPVSAHRSQVRAETPTPPLQPAIPTQRWEECGDTVACQRAWSARMSCPIAFSRPGRRSVSPITNTWIPRCSHRARSSLLPRTAQITSSTRNSVRSHSSGGHWRVLIPNKAQTARNDCSAPCESSQNAT